MYSNPHPGYFLDNCTGLSLYHIYVFLYSLYLKEEAKDFLEQSTLEELVKKYSQFINFNIYLWKSKTEEVEEPVEETEEDKKADEEKKDEEVRCGC